jgi:hypothetical protein
LKVKVKVKVKVNVNFKSYSKLFLRSPEDAAFFH